MSLLGLNSGEEEMMGREELLVELSKFKKLKAELKEMVECPVCVAHCKQRIYSHSYLQISRNSIDVHRCA